MKVLVTRTDRLGDLVLSLPVLALLKQSQPSWEIHAVVAPSTVAVVENDPNLARVWTWHDGLSGAGEREFAAELASIGFDVAVMLQYRRELAGLLRRAGIGRRYGPWSKWSSWFQLNRGLRQNRSAGTGHEMDFNLELGLRLLRDHGVEAAGPVPVPEISRDATQREFGREFRREFAIGGEDVVFIHPGSGGSALDWEPERFAAVARELARDSRCRVFVTGSAVDRDVVAAVAARSGPDVSVLQDRYSLRDFLAVLGEGDLLVGPSTGPLHLAAALGLPTLGLFPPVRTMHPDRWGPRGTADAVRENLIPAEGCPEKRHCRGMGCPRYSCLAELDVEGALTAARRILAGGPAVEAGARED